jgi:hypothetical protein
VNGYSPSSSDPEATIKKTTKQKKKSKEKWSPKDVAEQLNHQSSVPSGRRR